MWNYDLMNNCTLSFTFFDQQSSLWFYLRISNLLLIKPVMTIHRRLLRIGISWCISLTCIIVYSQSRIAHGLIAKSIVLWSSRCPSGHVVVARLHRQTARRCERVHRSGAQSKASPSDAHRRTYLAAASMTPGQRSRNSWWKIPLSLFFFFSFTQTLIHSFILFSLSLFLHWKVPSDFSLRKCAMEWSN